MVVQVPSLRAGMERVPVVAQVPEQPGSPPTSGRHDERGSRAARATRQTSQPSRRQRDDRDLRARPEAAAECEPEPDEVASRRCVSQAQDLEDA